MIKQTNVFVRLGEQSYEIEIGIGNLASIGSPIQKLNPSKLFLIYDENVVPHFHVVQKMLCEINSEVHSHKVASGEASKCLGVASELWDFLSRHQADRKSMVVAIGGGVVGDLAGFVAATYARGIPFFQVPTTLLSHVDSSVGGKTGINLPSAKNMVGAFWQPAGVLIDTQTLSTLEDREYVSGLAEVIKYGLIMDEPFFEKLEANVFGLKNRDADLLVDVIAHCCQLKANVVEEDEKETLGRRAILNYGHTFAHAFESVFGYGTYLHGEAVAVGMLCAGFLAKKMGRVDQAFCDRQEELVRKVGLPVKVDRTDIQPLIDVMKRDKKNVSNRIRFILPTRIGNVELVDAPIEKELLESVFNEFFQ